jgi:hypothetical protein
MMSRHKVGKATQMMPTELFKFTERAYWSPSAVVKVMKPALLAPVGVAERREKMVKLFTRSVSGHAASPRDGMRMGTSIS